MWYYKYCRRNLNSAITRWPVISNKIHQQLHISYVWNVITECIKFTPIFRDSLSHCVRHNDADCSHYVCLCTETNTVTAWCASESLFARIRYLFTAMVCRTAASHCENSGWQFCLSFKRSFVQPTAASLPSCAEPRLNQQGSTRRGL